MKTWHFILLAMGLTGCAAMASFGLYDPVAQEPTALADTLAATVQSITGVDILAAVGALKAVATVASNRNRENMARFVKGVNWKERLAAAAAVLFDTHTPRGK